MALFAQILGWMMAVWEMNPGLCSLILQVTSLVCAFVCISCCMRDTAASSRSVRVHVRQSGDVSVDVDQREPSRAPPQGRSPGTPARPIGGSHSEAPPPAPAMPRGARSKVKSQPHPRPAAVQQPVYIAPSQGRRYRKPDCSKALCTSGELVPLSREEAEGRKYTPCKGCKP